MKHLFLILTFACLNAKAQTTYEYYKNLDVSKVTLIQSELSDVISYHQNRNDYSDIERMHINNLNYFLKNPFDRNIKDFNLSQSLETLIELHSEILVLPSPGGGNKGMDGSDEVKPDSLKVQPIKNLPSVIPSGQSLTTQIVDALSKFLVERTKQELTITFYDNFKGKLNKPIVIKISDNDSIVVKLDKLFPYTYRLFESQEYFDTPSFGQTWIVSFKKDLIELPNNVEELLKSNEFLMGTEVGRYAFVSFDIIKKIKKGEHPMLVIESLNETYYINNTKTKEIDRMIGLLHLFSKSLTTNQVIDGVNQLKWTAVNDFKSLSEFSRKYLIGAIYQEGRKIELLQNIEFKGVSIEQLITEQNYMLLSSFIQKSLQTYNILDQELKQLNEEKTKKNLAEELKLYAAYLNTVYGLIDSSFENYYQLFSSSDFYSSKYYTEFKPIATDVVDFNNAIGNQNYVECLLLTNRFLNHLLPESAYSKTVIKNITFYGNFMVDIINTAEAEGDLKLIIEKYAMPVSSYRIKRSYNSSWDVAAFPGIYGSYEFSESNSFSYGVTAPIGISFSFKNKNRDNIELKSSSSTLFLSVIDIGAPFSYRFSNDEAEGLPENITWEQIFAPGFYYILGLKNSPLSIGVSAQFAPQLRKIDTGNQLEDKNIFRIGLSLLVDIPLFNLKKNETLKPKKIKKK